ncbi:MAG: hypothetical protein JXR77_02350 [Lentisphaeria bacterium]|nr:hypothetical protein [Lentisphaeria bacterium]
MAMRDQVEQAARSLRERFAHWDTPRALVQLGTGFAPKGLFDEEPEWVSMATLGLASALPSPAGHPLRAALGSIGVSQVLLYHGHRYPYEIGGLTDCVLPIAAAFLAGIRDVVLVDVGLSLREDLKPGTWLAATDYINAMGMCPIRGFIELVREPFLDMRDGFSQSLNAEIINAAATAGVLPRLGTFQGTSGPQFDTPAEAETARRNGADVIGHGVIPETVVAALLGCRVSALILIAESASSYSGRKLRREALADAAGFCSEPMMRSLRSAFLDTLPDTQCRRDTGADSPGTTQPLHTPAEGNTL